MTEDEIRQRDEIHTKITRNLALIDQMLAENWAVRVTHRRPFRQIFRYRVGRFLLYWLTMVAGMVFFVAFAGVLVLLMTWTQMITGSRVIAIAMELFVASFIISAWLYGSWSSRVTKYFVAWLQKLT